MRWNIIVECVGEDDKQSTITLGTIERPAGSTTAKNLRVNLQESKEIANRLQDAVVNQQLQEHSEQRRKCHTCGRLRPIKDFRRRRLDTVLGTVRLRVPRYRHCRCGCDTLGGSRLNAEPSKVFAVVGKGVRGRRQRGRDLETKLRVVSDGEDGMRSLVGQVFNANEQHVLDWYHIARRFEAIGKGLVYLPHVENFEHRLSRHWHHLNRAKWKVWHGNLYGANIALSSFYDGIDIHVMTAAADSGQSSAEQVRERMVELWSYLTANQTRLINYGREYGEGHCISTAHVESTVDQLVDWRYDSPYRPS